MVLLLTPLGEDGVRQDRDLAVRCVFCKWEVVKSITLATGGTAVAPFHPEMLTLLC